MAYLRRWFDVDPGWQHHTWVQRLGSDPKVNEASMVHGPDVLTAAAHTDQSNVTFKSSGDR